MIEEEKKESAELEFELLKNSIIKNDVDVGFAAQIAEAQEQRDYYLELFKADRTNEYLAKKFSLYHHIVESLTILLEESQEKEKQIFKNF